MSWAAGNEGRKCCGMYAGVSSRRMLGEHSPWGPVPADPPPAVLQHVPMPVLYGVFLHMGVAALNTIQVSGGAAGGDCFGDEGVDTSSSCVAEPGIQLCMLCSLAPAEERQRDPSGAEEREREVSGMLRSIKGCCTDGSGGSGEVEGPVEGPELLSKLQDVPMWQLQAELGPAGPLVLALPLMRQLCYSPKKCVEGKEIPTPEISTPFLPLNGSTLMTGCANPSLPPPAWGIWAVL